jgi:4-hydroxy-tetrahydrodipicolinate reductase
MDNSNNEFMKKVGLFGASGRVGQRIISLLESHQVLTLSTIYVRNKIDFKIPKDTLVTTDIRVFLKSCDVVIDFSLADATELLLESAINYEPKPLVIGTTGLTPHQKELISQASKSMPLLYATNMSLGIALLNQLVEIASKNLRDFDIEIVEMHHKHKKDAPSGTAITLGESVAKGRNLNLDEVITTGRNGIIGERKKDEISIMALRGGDIVGRHTVGFYNNGEFLEFNHTATSRDTFAKGALKAGEWLISQNNGLYEIKDCLSL